MGPASQQITAVHGCICRAQLIHPTLVVVALESKATGSRLVPVQAKPALTNMPLVGGITIVGQECTTTIEEFSVRPIIEIGSVLATVAKIRKTAKLRAAATLNQQPLRIASIFCDDINYAVDRVSPPQSRSRSTDHLNAIDILENSVLGIPKHSSIQRRIHCASIN